MREIRTSGAMRAGQPAETPAPATLPRHSGDRPVVEAVEEAFEGVLDASFFSEVDQDSQSMARKLEAGEDLLPMDGRQALDRLQLDEHQALHDEVGPKPLIELDALEPDRDRNVSCHLESALA